MKKFTCMKNQRSIKKLEVFLTFDGLTNFDCLPDFSTLLSMLMPKSKN